MYYIMQIINKTSLKFVNNICLQRIFFVQHFKNILDYDFIF